MLLLCNYRAHIIIVPNGTDKCLQYFLQQMISALSSISGICVFIVQLQSAHFNFAQDDWAGQVCTQGSTRPLSGRWCSRGALPARRLLPCGRHRGGICWLPDPSHTFRLGQLLPCVLLYLAYESNQRATRVAMIAFILYISYIASNSLLSSLGILRAI